MQYFGVRDLRERIGEFASSAQSGDISIISRHGKPLTVNVPFDDALISLGVHKALAIKLYDEGILTLSKAATYSGVKIDVFIQLLGAAGISVLGDSTALEDELKNIEK